MKEKIKNALITFNNQRWYFMAGGILSLLLCYLIVWWIIWGIL